jgi:hypothetical protein
MGKDPFDTLFTPDRLEGLFPADRADQFFEALFGDASEGAYDIELRYDGFRDNQLQFAFHLTERPGKCLSCSLTYGLPHVFSRHPVIGVAGLVRISTHCWTVPIVVGPGRWAAPRKSIAATTSCP